MNTQITKNLGIVLLLSSFSLADTAEDIDAVMATTDIAGKYASDAKETSLDVPTTLKQNIQFGSFNTSGNSDTLNINGKYDLAVSGTGLFDELMKIKFDILGFVTKNNEVRDNEEYGSNLGFEQIIGDSWL